MSLKDEVALAIENWLDTRRGANLNMLSKLSGVSYNTVLRLAQKEVEPTLKVLMLILPIVLPKEKYGEQASDLLLKHFPETAYFFKREQDAGIVPLEEVAEIENFCKEDFLVMSLAATTQGLKRDRAHEKFGEKAADSLERLLKAGVLIEKDGLYFTSKKQFKVLGHERALQEIRWLVESFDTKLLDQWGSLYRLKTEGLNDETILKIHKRLVEVSKEIGELMLDPANHGPNVMGYVLLSTFLDAPKGGAV